MSERELNVGTEDWPLAVPFQITGRQWTDLEAIVVEVAQAGKMGRGEAAGIYYLGETQDTMFAQLEAVRGQIESGASREDLLQLLPAGGARNAIDCALWDLEAKRTGKSIAALTGISPAPLTTVFTISIKQEPSDMAALAAQQSEFSVLKVKLNDDRPVERMEAIRAARPDATLIIDANQGFTIELLKDVLPHFHRLGIAMVEQPLKRGEDSALGGLKPPIPICADESLLDRSELDDISGRYQMINIKLDKAGGLTEAIALQKEAEKLGLPAMVGNMFGTSLAMAPAFLIGQSCRFVDLDGPLHLTKDRPDGLVYSGSQIGWPESSLWGTPD